MKIGTCTVSAPKVDKKIEKLGYSQAESIQDAVALCDGDEGRVIELFDRQYRIKLQAHFRQQMEEGMSEEDVIEQAPNWVYTGRPAPRRKTPNVEDAIAHYRAEGRKNVSLEELNGWVQEQKEAAAAEAEEEDAA